MIPKIIHQTSKQLTAEEARLGGRLREMLPGWEYRLWSDDANDELVREHFPQYRAAFQSIRRGVVRADIARYLYLYAHGGFYFDTDYKLLAPISDTLLDQACVLPVSRGHATDALRIGNAVLGSEPRHAFWGDFVDSIFAAGGLSELEESRVEKITGPEGLTDFFLCSRQRYPDILLVEREVFHPQLTRLGFSFAGTSKTVGAHLCWGSWRTKSMLGRSRAIAVRKLTSF